MEVSELLVALMISNHPVAGSIIVSASRECYLTGVIIVKVPTRPTQTKSPEWHEAMISANIDIFEMDYKEAVAYFICLENLEKTCSTNGPAPTLPVDNKTLLPVG